MEDWDLLLTVAEIAVAFAGFSGLVSVLGQRFSQSDPRLAASRLQSVIFTALLATGFALFPFLPDRFGASSEVTWRVSAGAFAIGWLAYAAAVFRRSLALHKSGVRLWSSLSTINFTLYILTIAALACVACGLMQDLAHGTYIFGLFVLLFVSGNVFVRVFLSLLHTDR